jgi:hypothetical protein
MACLRCCLLTNCQLCLPLARRFSGHDRFEGLSCDSTGLRDVDFRANGLEAIPNKIGLTRHSFRTTSANPWEP